MKYSNYLGVAACIALIGVCYFPWVHIASVDITVSGFDSKGTNYGQPGILNVILAISSGCCFLIPAVWAKRTNLFLAAFNMAWSVRNYFLLTQCELGECPEKKWGIYALLFLSFFILIMTLLPKLKVSK